MINQYLESLLCVIPQNSSFPRETMFHVIGKANNKIVCQVHIFKPDQDRTFENFVLATHKYGSLRFRFSQLLTDDQIEVLNILCEQRQSEFEVL